MKLALGGVIVFAVCAGMKALVGSSPFEASFAVNLFNAVVIFLPAAIIYLIWSKTAGLGFMK